MLDFSVFRSSVKRKSTDRYGGIKTNRKLSKKKKTIGKPKNKYIFRQRKGATRIEKESDKRESGSKIMWRRGSPLLISHSRTGAHHPRAVIGR